MKNLLIVDDEPMLIQNMKFLLQPFASRIFTAQNGKEGLAVLKSEEIHCVICDITMPVMNGVEFIKETRLQENHVPFIFYSAYGSHELMLEVAEYGAFDFLRKPEFRDLEQVVIRGLAEGFRRKNSMAREPEEFISEYQRLLDKVEDQNK